MLPQYIHVVHTYLFTYFFRHLAAYTIYTYLHTYIHIQTRLHPRQGLTLDPNGCLYRGPSGRPRTQPPQLGMLLRARASSGVAGTVGQTSPGVVRRRWCPLQASIAVLGFHFCCCLLVRIEFSDVWDPCLVCVYQTVVEVFEVPKGIFIFLLIV